VGNVVHTTSEPSKTGGLGLHFPGGSGATPPAPSSESGDAGRAVGRGRGSGRLCRCEAVAPVAAVGPGE
jgi:hypothetical protein